MAAVEKRVSCTRRHGRRRTLFGGMLYTDDGQAIECSISDISRSGARVRFGDTLEIGSAGDLKINKYGFLLRFRVQWVRDGYVGLEFKVSLDPDDESMKRFFSLID